MTARAAPRRTGVSFKDQLAELEQEQGPAARTGLVLVRWFLLRDGRTESDVIALEVSPGRCRTERRAGESLDELEQRANPSASWCTIPMPVCHDETRALTPREWAQAVQLDAQRNGGSMPPLSAPQLAQQ